MSTNQQTNTNTDIYIALAVSAIGAVLYFAFALVLHIHHVVNGWGGTVVLAAARSAWHNHTFTSYAEQSLFAVFVASIPVVIFAVMIMHRRDLNSSKDLHGQIERKRKPKQSVVDSFSAKTLRTKYAPIVRWDLPDPTSVPNELIGSFIGRVATRNQLGGNKDNEIWLSYESSILIYGPPRSGKNYYLFNGMCAQHAGPVIITAVRADVLASTGPYRSTLGQVLVFDPANQVDPAEHPYTQRVYFDILDGCEDPYVAKRRIDSIVSVVTSSDKSHADAGARFYTTAASNILTLLFIHAARRRSAGKPASLDDTINILKLFGCNVPTMRFIEEAWTQLTPTDQVFAQNAYTLAQKALQPQSVKPDDPVSSPTELFTGQETLTLERELFEAVCNTFQSCKQETFLSFLSSTLAQITEIFTSSLTRSALVPQYDSDGRSTNAKLDLTTFLKHQYNSLYVLGGAEAQQLVAPLIVTIINEATQLATKLANATNPKNPRLAPPLGLYLDELPSLAPLPNRLFTTLLSTGAGSGIRLCAVVQDLAFVSAKWGSDFAKTLQTTSGALIVLPGSNDTTFLRDLTTLAGNVLVSPKDSNKGDEREHQAYRIEELRQLDSGTAIVFAGNRPPVIVDLVPYTAHPWYKRSHERHSNGRTLTQSR